MEEKRFNVDYYIMASASWKPKTQDQTDEIQVAQIQDILRSSYILTKLPRQYVQGVL